MERLNEKFYQVVSVYYGRQTSCQDSFKHPMVDGQHNYTCRNSWCSSQWDLRVLLFLYGTQHYLAPWKMHALRYHDKLVCKNYICWLHFVLLSSQRRYKENDYSSDGCRIAIVCWWFFMDACWHSLTFFANSPLGKPTRISIQSSG